MASVRIPWSRIPVFGVLIALLFLARDRYHRKTRIGRPTVEQLLRMSDADFSAFIASTGIKTVTTAGLVPGSGFTD